MSTNGGVRPGAGRPKGARNKATAKREQAIAASGLTPLEYMLRVLRDEEMPSDRRDWAAEKAAPYVHPRLNSTTLDANVQTETHEERLKRLAGL